MPAKNYNEVCAVQAIPTPKMELSDRLKQIIKELAVTEEVLCETMFNVDLTRPDGTILPQPECHFQSVDMIELLVSNIQRISSNLQNKLR